MALRHRCHAGGRTTGRRVISGRVRCAWGNVAGGSSPGPPGPASPSRTWRTPIPNSSAHSRNCSAWTRTATRTPRAAATGWTSPTGWSPTCGGSCPTSWPPASNWSKLTPSPRSLWSPGPPARKSQSSRTVRATCTCVPSSSRATHVLLPTRAVAPHVLLTRVVVPWMPPGPLPQPWGTRTPFPPSHVSCAGRPATVSPGATAMERCGWRDSPARCRGPGPPWLANGARWWSPPPSARISSWRCFPFWSAPAGTPPTPASAPTRHPAHAAPGRHPRAEDRRAGHSRCASALVLGPPRRRGADPERHRGRGRAH